MTLTAFDPGDTILEQCSKCCAQLSFTARLTLSCRHKRFRQQRAQRALHFYVYDKQAPQCTKPGAT